MDDPRPVLGKELVAGQLVLLVLLSGAPAQVPGPDRRSVDRGCGDNEQRQRRGAAKGEGGTGNGRDAGRGCGGKRDRTAQHRPERPRRLHGPERAGLDNDAFHAPLHPYPFWPPAAERRADSSTAPLNTGAPEPAPKVRVYAVVPATIVKVLV